MEISARNQLPGTVTRVTLGSVMAEVAMDVAGQEVVAAVTRSSVERHLGHDLAEGHAGDRAGKLVARGRRADVPRVDGRAPGRADRL